MRRHVTFLVFFFFNDTATTEIYTLSLHDALPICEHNGIRLITIHKSKGLEFDHVIMPFCDWQLEKQSLIWCRPTVAPYNQLSLIPVDFNKYKMTNSIFDQDYYLEHLQNIVDNLNLL